MEQMTLFYNFPLQTETAELHPNWTPSLSFELNWPGVANANLFHQMQAACKSNANENAERKLSAHARNE
jgi:hypothetical protein